jgi:hypothetical protein
MCPDHLSKPLSAFGDLPGIDTIIKNESVKLYRVIASIMKISGYQRIDMTAIIFENDRALAPFKTLSSASLGERQYACEENCDEDGQVFGHNR